MTKICNDRSSRNTTDNIDFKTKIIRKIHPSNENYNFIAEVFREMERQEKK